MVRIGGQPLGFGELWGGPSIAVWAHSPHGTDGEVEASGALGPGPVSDRRLGPPEDGRSANNQKALTSVPLEIAYLFISTASGV